MVEVTFFDEADFLDEDEAFVAMMNQGTFKFNQTAFKWMKLKDFKCMKIGHDSLGNPELATKLFFVPNNEEPKKGINFKFCNYAGSGNSTISCKRIIYQNSNLSSLIESRDAEMKRLKITFDEKTKLHCHLLTPQFCSVLAHEHLYKATSISCIYSLYQNNDLNYIGETRDLKQTITRHQGEGKKFDKVRYSALKNNENLRKYWERFFLLKYKEENNGRLPEYNKLVPYETKLEQQNLISIEERKVVNNG